MRRNMEKTILELISEVDEFVDIHEMFNDKDMDMALSKIVRIISNPDINPAAAATAVIHLQGLATKFYVQASYIKNVSKPKAGTDEYAKKNMLFAIASALNELVAALKYGVRQ
jgi:hypothetical protein